ncbi:MAG TPA: type II toxin-antitoxin system RelE/ParE family toxin [Dongiaceae bacterium]|jgi:phage-related protein|nr:type II toxin-antitoxin system RelE/ParE family toxin [Dongiaceae bacterium]
MRETKVAVFLGDTYRVICEFPGDARRAAGYQIGRIQEGSEPDDWKPFSTIGPNVREIRIRERSGAFRIIYQATLPDVVLVLNAFRKSTQKTPQHEIDKARARLSDYMARGAK